MGRKPTKAYKSSKQAFFEFLKDDAAQLMIGILKIEDMTDDNEVVTLLLHKSGERFPIAGRTLQDFIEQGLNVANENSDNRLKKMFDRLKNFRQQLAQQQLTDLASHQEKRTFVHQLGLDGLPYSIDDVHIINKVSSGTLLLVERQRLPDSQAPFKSQCFMSDVPAGPAVQHVGDATGFHAVEKDVSVIFIAPKTEGSPVEIELAVIRDVGEGHEFSPGLYSWFHKVVDTACRKRRDVRPGHGGKMVQMGLNAGPRHARVSGWAVSFTAKLSDSEMEMQDSDVIAAAGMAWRLSVAVLPSEITQPIEDVLRKEGLPRMATQNIEEGTGFKLDFNNKLYNFTKVERSPPEAYMSRAYVAWSHTDPAYTKYALALCVHRFVPSGEEVQDSVIRRSTRATKKNEVPITPPIGVGANFVDVTLKVVVQQAEGTLIAFKANKLHGTTLGHGTINHMITITFSKRVLDAFLEAQEQHSVQDFEGSQGTEGEIKQALESA